MGNVCGCVRAQKEEYYIDPAKAPFSPGKNSSGRRFFRRRKSDKRKESENCDGATVTEAENNRDGYSPEDFFLGVSTKTSPVAQRSSKYVCNIPSADADCLAALPLESYSSGNVEPTAQRELCLENISFAVNRNLSFPNIPNTLTFLPNTDACYEKTASGLSSVDCIIAQETTSTNSCCDRNGESDVNRQEEMKSSDCLVYARYYSAAELDRPSYVSTLPSISRDDLLSSSCPALQVNMTDLNKYYYLCLFSCDSDICEHLQKMSNRIQNILMYVQC